MPATAPADPDVIASRLRHPIWRRIDHVATTGSTNRDLLARAHSGEAPPIVLISEHQSSGRGRLNRVWEAPAGASLAVSILVQPDAAIDTWSWVPLIAGMAVRSAIIQATGAQAGRVVLKWPNDVLVDPGISTGGKVAGILAERVADPQAVVVGIGLNTDLAATELPVPTATSLALCDLAVSKDDLLVALLDEFAGLLDTWASGAAISQSYAAACASVGQQVRVQSTDGDVVGLATGVDPSGRLIVDAGGRTHHLAAGDVVHLR